jgi:hypothetical protein
MILNSKFDVLRGWPREGAIDESYLINQTVPNVDDALPLGTVFFVNATGKAQATGASPNRTTTNAVSTWVVVAGNDDFSSQFVHKVVGLRSNAELKLDPSNFNAGTYTPGVKLTFAAGGKWQPAVATNQIIGEVLQDNTATDGTIVVMYTGGDAASF